MCIRDREDTGYINRVNQPHLSILKQYRLLKIRTMVDKYGDDMEFERNVGAGMRKLVTLNESNGGGGNSGTKHENCGQKDVFNGASAVPIFGNFNFMGQAKKT